MSTKLTRSPKAKHPLVESQSLTLVQAIRPFQGRIMTWLLDQLAGDGFDSVTAAQLSFMGALECNAKNHAADLARGLGITRQAVHKTVAELEAAGLLETEPDPDLGNQRAITFTEEGERLMACARQAFQRLDTLILQELTDRDLNSLRRFFEFDPNNF